MYKVSKILRNILEKKSDLAVAQFVQYFFVGGTAAIFDILAFLLFVRFIDYRLAIFFSFSIGTFINYLLCNAFIFKRKNLSFLSTGVRHYFSSLGGLMVNEVVAIFLIEVLFFENMLIVKLIATGCAFIVNFTLIKFFAFNHKIKILSK